MRERLEFLLEKNKFERDRVAHSEDFSRDVRRYTTLDPDRMTHTLFEETRVILEKIRTIKTNTPVIEWETESRQDFDERLGYLERKIPNSRSYLFFLDNYFFMSAMHVNSKDFFDNIRGFFSLGEETMILVDRSFENYVKIVEYEEVLNESGYFHSITVCGNRWPKLAQECFSRIE